MAKGHPISVPNVPWHEEQTDWFTGSTWCAHPKRPYGLSELAPDQWPDDTVNRPAREDSSGCCGQGCSRCRRTTKGP